MRFETINLGVPGPPGPASIVPGPTGPEGPQGIPGPPGGESGSVNGVLSLRAIPPVSGQTLPLNYHTAVGDYGAGQFYGVTGAAAGTYVDNDGTIIVPTGGDGSTAWLRVWDGVKAHVGWFGAACTPMNLASDDYIPVTKCLGLFTNGRNSAAGLTGIVDVGPGFCFSQPLIYGGSGDAGFKLVGRHSLARGGQEKSLLRYTGPATLASIIFYGANEWSIEDINTYPNLALNGILVTADNSYNNAFVHTTTGAITAGSNVVVSPAGGATPADKVNFLQPGVLLGVDAGGDNFEIVAITAVDTVAGTFTADFAKSHASGVLLGGGAPCSSGFVNRCRIMVPVSPIWTTLTAPSVAGADTTFTVADIAGITIGRPLRVGSLLYAEVVHPKTINVGAKTFTADSSYAHASGAIVMYPTAGIAFGNRLLSTVQVDNVSFHDTTLVGGGATNPSRCYAGVRQFWGGNVKAFMFHQTFPAYCRVAFAFEQASGQYLFSGGTSAGIEELLWLCGSGHLSVYGWEDEGASMWLVGQSGGNAAQATFIGCTMQGAAPTLANDEMFIFGGNLTFVGCDLRNGRVANTTLPIIVSLAVLQDIFPSSLSLIGCHVASATLASMNFVHPASGDATDVLKDGTGKVTMLNCTGGWGGAIVRLPDVLPPLKMWQGTATYDPPSLLANTAGTAQTMAVAGAVLGDLVEVSFSQNLGEMLLRAWVSAADTVSYQFRNPTASPIDLVSGTVKCRVKK